METNPVTPAPGAEAPKSNRNIIIAVVVVVVLCCCCVVTGTGGYYGYQAYLTAQTAVEDFQDFDIPTDVPFNPLDPNATPGVPNLDVSGDVPAGGLADDETRFMAWASVQLVSIMYGCTTPTVDGTTITVTQEPDSAGVWHEEWNVNCGDGSSKAFPVTFTPENGIVNVTVDIQP